MLILRSPGVLGDVAASQHALATLGWTEYDRSAHMATLSRPTLDRHGVAGLTRGEPAPFGPSTFVLQRRIGRPFELSCATIANPAVFGRGSVLCDGPDGSLILDGPFRRVVLDPRATWLAPASLLGAGAHRRIAAVE